MPAGGAGGTTIVAVPEVTVDVVAGTGTVSLVTLIPGIVTVVVGLLGARVSVEGSSVQVV